MAEDWMFLENMGCQKHRSEGLGFASQDGFENYRMGIL
jgi:hypothetical protein